MKKVFSLILVFAMTVGMSFNAFAANNITNGGTDSADVKGTYSSEATVTVYSVDISWSGLEFVYNGAFEGNWNPATHEYEDATGAGWAAGNGVITVKNHSNTGITATPSYIAKAGFESASMNFSTTALQIATADNGVDGAAGTAVEGTITVTPNGSLPENTQDAVIGTITITIN